MVSNSSSGYLKRKIHDDNIGYDSDYDDKDYDDDGDDD